MDSLTPLKGHWEVNGIPHAFVIGPDGKIVWRGHPNVADIDGIVASLLADLTGGER